MGLCTDWVVKEEGKEKSEAQEMERVRLKKGKKREGKEREAQSYYEPKWRNDMKASPALTLPLSPLLLAHSLISPLR